jgi:hypothetical protein
MDSPNFESQTIFTKHYIIWIVATLVLTPVVAGFLSVAGYIPMDALSAAFNGLLVALVYVGFRVANSLRISKLKSNVRVRDEVSVQ